MSYFCPSHQSLLNQVNSPILSKEVPPEIDLEIAAFDIEM
jgi:hypothetical protein